MEKDVIEKVLVALDGNVGSIKALHMGVKLAKSFGCELKYVYIAPMTDVYQYELVGEAQFEETLRSFKEEGRNLRELLSERGKRALEIANTSIKESGVVAEEIVKIGNNSEEIVKAAREIGADIIIIGVNIPNPAFKNSTAQEVAEISPCSVLVVAPTWSTFISK